MGAKVLQHSSGPNSTRRRRRDPAAAPEGESAHFTFGATPVPPMLVGTPLRWSSLRVDASQSSPSYSPSPRVATVPCAGGMTGRRQISRCARAVPSFFQLVVAGKLTGQQKTLAHLDMPLPSLQPVHPQPLAHLRGGEGAILRRAGGRQALTSMMLPGSVTWLTESTSPPVLAQCARALLWATCDG